jgi:hypothetical protein
MTDLRWWAALMLLLAFSIMMSLMHANTVRELRLTVHESQTLKSASHLPLTLGTTQTGDPVTVAPDLAPGQWQLILIGSPRCAFTMSSLDAWADLTNAAASAGHEVIVLATEWPTALEGSLGVHGVEAVVAAVADERSRGTLRLGVAPQVVIVGSMGRIAAAHTGALSRGSESFRLLRSALEPD